MKDHELARLINQLRYVAETYGQTQQLREQIKAVLMPYVQEIRDEENKAIMAYSAICLDLAKTVDLCNRWMAVGFAVHPNGEGFLALDPTNPERTIEYIKRLKK